MWIKFPASFIPGTMTLNRFLISLNFDFLNKPAGYLGDAGVKEHCKGHEQSYLRSPGYSWTRKKKKLPSLNYPNIFKDYVPKTTYCDDTSFLFVALENRTGFKEGFNNKSPDCSPTCSAPSPQEIMMGLLPLTGAALCQNIKEVSL